MISLASALFFALTAVNVSCLSWPFGISSDIRISDSVTPLEKAIWDYLQDKIRGISLGGWFVLEPYITPSLFEQFGVNECTIPVDEYTFTKTLGKEKSKEQLERHWSTYYSEADFLEISNYGLNLVRIPIGYWAFKLLPDDPYVQGQEKYLDQAIEWARRYRLKVWIDLHGVPGSQNGFDNSGKRGPVQWTDTLENLQVSAKALDYIFMKYSGDSYSDTIIGIEVVNEPMMPALNQQKAVQFHYDMYHDYRERYKSNNYFLIQEGFLPLGWWDEQLNNDYPLISQPYTLNVSSVVLQNNYFNGIVIDYHHYEVFTDAGVLKTSAERVLDIQNYAKVIGLGQKFHPSLVGEWSGAITDCAKWLNGVGRGARYDATFNLLSTLNGSVSSGNSAVPIGLSQKSSNNKTEVQDEDLDYNENESVQQPDIALNEDEDLQEDNDEEYDYFPEEEDSDEEDQDEDDYTGYGSTKLVRRHAVSDRWIQADVDSSSKNLTALAASRSCADVRLYNDFSSKHKMEIRKFIEVQLVEYEKNGAGWIFWNWKTEDAIEWDFQRLVKNNLFPMPLSDYKYFYTNGTEVPMKTSAALLSQLGLLLSSNTLLSVSLVLFGLFIV